MKQILVTGGDGFIGQNLRVRLSELGYEGVVSIDTNSSPLDFAAAVRHAEFVFHLAGVNRPKHPREFDVGNRAFTAELCAQLRATGRRIPIAFSSSTQALLDNPYGRSKLAAEQEVANYGAETHAAASIIRLPNVFGKWSRPNYNSAVATFCHSIARGLPVTINDPSAPIQLAYIDDVIATLTGLLSDGSTGGIVAVKTTYDTTVGEIVAMLRQFAESRDTLLTERVGVGLTRALYATYVSHLPGDQFAYSVRRHADARGVFVEMLKTPDCGQFSFFTAHPGITRGGHYHHTKTEKFLVVKGTARFAFRHLVTNETRECVVTDAEARVVETVPGWAHDVTNVGAEELIVMLWANEIFDPARPDTVAARVATQ